MTEGVNHGSWTFQTTTSNVDAVLSKEFAQELKEYGRIYMYRFRPDYKIHSRPINEYPHQSKQAAAIMLMLQNNS